jgi:cell division protein YceG involved in septum cleavage
MLREFDKKIGSSYNSLDPKRAYETLILASIVEREERVSVNQPIVAGILSKRVKE